MNYSNESVCTIVVEHNPEMPTSGHYMKSYMSYRTITISFYDCNGKKIFVSDEILAKMPQKPNFQSKEIQILGENGINSKLKHRKAHLRGFIQEIW